MSWTAGTVRLGFGLTPFHGEVLFFNDPNPILIKHASVASGYRFPAFWEFDQYTGTNQIS